MRVIAGTFGGRRIRAPRGARTRPTSDRVREALFSATGPVAGLSVLDLYAGSGALAIEALSRGAARAVLVERSRAALAVLRANLSLLGLGHRAAVVALPLERAGGAVRARGPYDLVLVDPPYEALAAGVVATVLGRLLPSPGVLVAGARLVLEHAARDEAPALAGMSRVRTRAYGDTALSSYVAAGTTGLGALGALAR
ncbi:MAG: 16S rRNA (guanine(966)-N(2))-methyltransferase RsmD [Deltaproteobacteria bacterium]|nr:16S rRNA (guanine(966)-N(2))-methyltransferase RsmD [Deltaproteobacteria bacterium]